MSRAEPSGSRTLTPLEGMGEAIVHEEFPLDLKSPLEDQARTMIEASLDDMTLHRVGNKVVHANEGGLSIRQTLAKVQSELAEIKRHLKINDRRAGATEQDITHVNIFGGGEARVILRHRVLDVYRRDGLGDKDPQLRRLISESNTYVYSARAAEDALLYSPKVQISRLRKDVDVFESLYGLTPSEVERITYETPESLTVLDGRAEFLLKGESVPPEVEKAWAGFIAAVRGHPEQRPNDDDFHEVKNAYWIFHREFGKLGKGKAKSGQ